MFEQKFESYETFNGEPNNALTITSLPPELIELCSAFLDIKSLLLMRATCQLFYSALEHELMRRIRNSKPKQIAFGGEYLILLHEDGTVSEHKIDKNNLESILTCNMERLPNLCKIVQVAANNRNRFYLDVEGNVWFTSNSCTKTICGKDIHTSPPKLLSNVTNVTQLVVKNPEDILFIKSDGSVLSYGYLNHRISSNPTGSSDPDELYEELSIKPLEWLEDNCEDIRQIEFSINEIFLLKKEGTVFVKKRHSNLQKATQIPELTDIVQMCIGDNYFFIKNDHSIWGYGPNYFGGLGIGHDEPVTTPISLSNLSSIHQVFARFGYTFFITENGALLYTGMCFGLRKSYIPIPLVVLSKVKQILDVTQLLPLEKEPPSLFLNFKRLFLFLTEDGRILSVDSDDILQSSNSCNISAVDKLNLNKWFRVHGQFSSHSGFFFHNTTNYQMLETQLEATRQTEQALERAIRMEKEFTDQTGEKELETKSDDEKARCRLM